VSFAQRLADSRGCAIDKPVMELFIVRHAHAVNAEENPERPLSSRGREQVRQLTAFLEKSGSLSCGEVWHSPLTRSRETAKLLTAGLALNARLVEVDGLEGEADPTIIVGRLQSRREPLAIVGHEPHLSALASQLVAATAEPPRFVLKKCAVLALERGDDVWRVRWHVSPEILVG
jgi:phosphohistidine phosphatase